jgi:ubiquinone/menaquinone biosynthesis C-methylase UbiE
VTDCAERYDRVAAGYLDWWAPVLEPRAVQLLDRVDGAVAAGGRPVRLLDIGTGTGTLARAAIRRWPHVEVVGIDVSRGMTEVAEGEAERQLAPADRRRFSTRVAPAAELPFGDATFDVAISSFVLQLVPNRFRALREAHRVLRPGGTLAYVTWLVDDRRFRPDEILDDLLDEIGIGAREADPRTGDVPTEVAAAAQLRRAGFHRVESERAILEYRFSVDHYIRFVTEFDEETLFDELSRSDRAKVVDGLRARLSRLAADELVLRLAIVYASGIRP